jgi:hypothetical protein
MASEFSVVTARENENVSATVSAETSLLFKNLLLTAKSVAITTACGWLASFVINFLINNEATRFKLGMIQGIETRKLEVYATTQLAIVIFSAVAGLVAAQVVFIATQRKSLRPSAEE